MKMKAAVDKVLDDMQAELTGQKLKDYKNGEYVMTTKKNRCYRKMSPEIRIGLEGEVGDCDNSIMKRAVKKERLMVLMKLTTTNSSQRQI